VLFLFADHMLDTDRRELRRGSAHRCRAASVRFAIVPIAEAIAWPARTISSLQSGAAGSCRILPLTSRIKSARNAVGDRFLSARQRPQLAGSCDLLFDTVLGLTRVEARPRTDQKAVGSAIPPHPAHTIGRIQARPICGGYIINISGFDLW